MTQSPPRLSVPPLTEEETVELKGLLVEGDEARWAFARGLLTGAACSVSLRDPVDFLPILLGDRTGNAGELRRVIALTMREYHAIAECLSLDVPSVPAADDEIAVFEFCRGLVQTAQRDPVLSKDTGALTLLFPLAAIAGYLTEESLKKVEPSSAGSFDDYLSAARTNLSDTVSGLYVHLGPARAKKNAEAAEAAEKSKVGRNEPCPCGSGQKYKKCCGAGS